MNSETDPPSLIVTCLFHQQVPKWLQMVLDYDLLHRNKLSTLFLSSLLTRGWVALTFFMFFLTNFSTHWILHCPTSVNFMACNVCTAQNAVQDMASKSYGRLGVAKFLSPDPTNICLQNFSGIGGSNFGWGSTSLWYWFSKAHSIHIVCFLKVRPSCSMFNIWRRELTYFPDDQLIFQHKAFSLVSFGMLS